MASNTLMEVFGHVLFSFTRGVTEYYNPEEHEFTAESLGYYPLESTGREWYCQPIDELIYQEYSERETTSRDYLTFSSLNVRVIDACSPKENEETTDDQRDEDSTAMAWKRLRPSPLRTVCKSMYIAALISLLTASVIGTIYVLISYLCFTIELNCQFQKAKLIPTEVQWMRTIAGIISACFLYFWYLANLLFLFRPFQLMGLKGKLFLVCVVIFCLDALYRFALQALSFSHSFISVSQTIPLNILFLISVCLQVYIVVNHLCTRSTKERLTLSFQFLVPGCFGFFIFIITAYLLYPAYDRQNKEGKLLIALFAPLIGVVLKVFSRICVQRMYITHPGYSYVLLLPLYFGSAVMFRVLQADLDSLQSIALLSIIHGTAEVMERSTMVVVDHICHTLWKRQSSPWGSFRTPRRERLMADIAILSMWSESTAIVSVNGLLYLYQFVYLQNKSTVELLETFAIHTSVQLSIEWFFTALSLAIETRYQNMAVMAVWQRRWKRHILAAIVNVVPLAVWTSAKLLVTIHARFHGPVNQTCKLSFS